MKKKTGGAGNFFRQTVKNVQAYFRKLLFPVYLFPLKLITYSLYYFIQFILKLIFAILTILLENVRFPFTSVKNFLRSLVRLAVAVYLLATLFVISDYIRTHYGWIDKYFCSLKSKSGLKQKTVRIIGGYSEGSGFFISGNQVLTNFHVIADEPSPKIIFPDGSFTTPVKITGSRDADLAVLFTRETYPHMVMVLVDEPVMYPDEPVISTGYALGTTMAGKATSVAGNFIDYRQSKKDPVGFIQTNISLVEGMSGGPLTDQCGNVVGVNTLGLSGLSMFITSDYVKALIPKLTDQEIKKISVNPAASPEEAVKAFYTYLKARKMKEGFALLSREYLKKTDFTEWTNRFTDIVDVDIFVSRRHEKTKDTAYVKFATKNWVDGEIAVHYYEGTWQTVQEDGVWKMLRSKILEVDNPSWEWFYE